MSLRSRRQRVKNGDEDEVGQSFQYPVLFVFDRWVIVNQNHCTAVVLRGNHMSPHYYTIQILGAKRPRQKLGSLLCYRFTVDTIYFSSNSKSASRASCASLFEKSRARSTIIMCTARRIHHVRYASSLYGES